MFYKTEGNSLDTEPKQSYCSIARRLYNLDGSLLQGSTGFFSLTQPTLDEVES